MGYKVDFYWEGFQEFEETLNDLVQDYGMKDARRVLTKAVKQAMEPVLFDAKLRAPVDTGALSASLWIEARKPTNKDKRSKYVNKDDAVIAAVTTAPGYKLAKTSFHNRKNTTSNIKQVGVKSDARAVAMEFGTANVAAKPFLRPAIESNSANVVNSLGDYLKVELEKYEKRLQRKLTKKRG